MGHLPISGADGSLKQLAPLPIERKVYIHINNTNPILLKTRPSGAPSRSTAWKWPRMG